MLDACSIYLKKINDHFVFPFVKMSISMDWNLLYPIYYRKVLLISNYITYGLIQGNKLYFEIYYKNFMDYITKMYFFIM